MNFPEFKYLENLIYIIFPIACIILFILGYRKKEKIMRLIRINRRIDYKTTRIVLSALGLGLILFSLLGPQAFNGYMEVNRRGLDIYVLIDTSKSMLVEDVKPDRITRAKKVIENLIDNLDGDRIGFIPYSSAAYVQMPLTDDYQLAKMFLDVVDTDMIGGGGTNAGTALKLAYDSFERTSSADKVIIILSDGEEHEKDSLNTLNSIKDEHMKVFTIGIGSEKGGLIPVYDATGERINDYKKDDNGQYVMSKLDRKALQGLASGGGGTYYEFSISGNEINSLVNEISSLKRDTLKTDKIRRYKELYQYFLGAGMLLFLMAYLLPERRNG